MTLRTRILLSLAPLALLARSWARPAVGLTVVGPPSAIAVCRDWVGPDDDVVDQTMLILGGGYDACEDSDPHTCTSSTKGNSIFVLDADTGQQGRDVEFDLVEQFAE